jgi:hypothetical protein
MAGVGSWLMHALGFVRVAYANLGLEAVPLLAGRLHVPMHGVLPARTKKEFVIFGSICKKCIAILSKMSTFI